MARRFYSTVLTALVAWPTVAEAHSPIKGIGTFYSHMLHPLLVPAHALLLIAIGLMLGQQGREKAGIGLLIFGSGLIAGLLLASAGVVAGVRETILLAASLVVGGGVSLGRSAPTLITLGIASIVGVTMGIDSAPEATAIRDQLLAYAGLMTGVLYLAIIICGLTVNPVQHWQRIAIRIAGSWIAAASILVLTLTLAGPVKHAAACDFTTWKERRCCGYSSESCSFAS